MRWMIFYCSSVFSLMQMYKRIFIILIPFPNNEYYFIMKVSSVILQCHNNGTGDAMMIHDHQRCALWASLLCLSSVMSCLVSSRPLVLLTLGCSRLHCVVVCVNDDIMLFIYTPHTSSKYYKYKIISCDTRHLMRI